MSRQNELGALLVFDDEELLVQALRKKFPQRLIQQVKTEESYQSIINKHNFPSTIICRLSLSHGADISDKVIEEQLKRSYFAVFSLVQSLMQQKLSEPIRIICVNEIEEGNLLYSQKRSLGY